MPDILHDLYYQTEGMALPVGFKIYYGNGDITVGKGNQGQMRQAFNQADKTDVQVIMIFEQTLDALGRPTRVVIAGRDFYWYDANNGRITATNNPESITKNAVVLEGSMMEDEAWAEMIAKAMDDYDL